MNHFKLAEETAKSIAQQMPPGTSIVIAINPPGNEGVALCMGGGTGDQMVECYICIGGKVFDQMFNTTRAEHRTIDTLGSSQED